MRKSPQIANIKADGFALVITLMMLVLAAIVAIALLTNASQDRLTAASYDDRYHAELAAQSGLEAAKQALFAVPPSGTSQTQNDGFIVFSSVDSNNVPYYYIGSAESGTASSPTIQYFPLYSGGTISPAVSMSAGLAPSPTPPPAPTEVASQQFSKASAPIYYPKLFPSPAPHALWQPSIRTSWQYLPTPTPAPGPTPKQYRYTYWVEDLAGYVDANVAGNTNNGGTAHTRPLGYDPNEIAAFTLFDAGANQADTGSTYASTFLTLNHPLLFSRQNTRVGTTTNSPDDTVCVSTLVANLQPDYEQMLIPYGMGYKNQGQLKTNLNQLIADISSKERTADAAIDGAVPAATSPTPAASPIVPTITDNLPNFASARQGGLSSSAEGYLETIAANIIDYGDSDSTPTVGTNAVTSKHYRGIDLMPFVTEVYEMYIWDTPPTQPPGGNYFVNVRVRTYVHLWNMFSQPINSGVLLFNDKLAAGIQFIVKDATGKVTSTTPGNPASFDKATANGSNAGVDLSKTPLKANEYRAVLAWDRSYTFDTGTPTKPSEIQIGDQASPTSFDKHSSYEVQWNTVPYDRPGITNSGNPFYLERNTFTLNSQGDIQFVGTVPGLRYANTNSGAFPTQQGPPYLLGDPRSSYYIQDDQYDASYPSNSSWGGQVYMSGLAQTSNWCAAESRIAGWADGGHNFTRGSLPKSATTDPTTITQQTPDGTKAPARISNRSDGRIYSITELSYIYDPFQWDPFNTSNSGTYAVPPTKTTDVDAAWHNTWRFAFNAANANYGSHSTLRIGRPEHKSFDQNGTRAWQLLDIFSAGDPSNAANGGTSNQLNTRGKININTAQPETLRALGAGIQIGNLNAGDVDPAIQPAAVYSPQNAKAADIFAQYVIAQRTKQPFLSTSQLAALPGSSSEPFFGNSDQWASGGPTEWNDAASEQYFAKIYNLTTVRSRNFRVFVTGQYIDPNSNDPYTGKPPRVIATANKVYEVFLQPTRNASGANLGAITSQQCVVTYQADVQ